MHLFNEVKESAHTKLHSEKAAKLPEMQ